MRDCPDLTILTAEEKKSFWMDKDPRTLRRLADRLLAESLPHVTLHRSREEISQDIAQRRAQTGLTIEQVCHALKLNPEMMVAWEEDRVKAPECLPYVVNRLGQLLAASSD